MRPRAAALGLWAALAAGCAPAPPPADRPATLLVLTDRDVEGLDPHLSGDVFQTDQLLANVYEGLVWRRGDMMLEPALAVSWTNPDDLTWDFVLRREARFHDGRPLTADDVVWSLDRARRRGAFRSGLATIREVVALDEGRVRVRTRQPDAALLSRLWKAWVVSRTFVEAHGEKALESTSAGTGPYRVVSRQAGTGVDLEAVPGHWRGPLAFPRVRFLARSFGDPSVPRGLPTVFWLQPGTRAYGEAQKSAVLRVRGGLSVSYLDFDLHGPTTPAVRLAGGATGNPFLDPRVRRAVALAIDHERLKADSFGDQALVPTQPVAPAVLGYDPSLPAPARNLAEARRLLAETPYREGFEVYLDLRQMMARYGPPLVRDLAEVGITVRPRLWSEEDFFALLSAGGSSLFVARFSCRTGDAQEYLDKWVHSRDEALGYGEGNFSYAADPVPGLDRTIDRARGELVPMPRLRLLHQALRQVTEERLAVPLLGENDVVFATRGLAFEARADAFRLAWEMRPE